MLKKSQNVNKFEIIDILEMAQIIYSDGKKDIFEAIHITNEGIHTGRIINNYEFLNGGFIPKYSIKEIKGGTKRKLYLMKSKKC